MKKISNLSILVIVFLVIHLSCSEDWLEPKPLSFYAPENVYINKEGFNALLITMKKDIAKEHYDQVALMVNEFAGSDLCVPASDHNGTVMDFTNNVTPGGDGGWHSFASRLFDHAYDAIKSTNILISRIDNGKWNNEQDKNYCLAVAYFFRAYWYYRLVNAYGDVPFTGAEIMGPKLDFYTYSRWAILQKIQSDMEFAVQWLPVTADIGEVTRGAANQLLTKIYLANTEFDKAIVSSTEVINGPYALMTNRFGSYKNDPKRNIFWDLHRVENINNPLNTETIFSIIDRFEAPSAAQNLGIKSGKREGNVLPRSFSPQWWHPNTLDSKGLSGTQTNGPEFDTLFYGAAYARPSPYYLYEIWDYKNDLRRSDLNWVDKHEILYNNPKSVDYNKPINPFYFANILDSFANIYAIPHYIVFIPEQDPNAKKWGGSGDSYIFRLAETFLLRAEAYYWKGNLDLAAADLNMVRQRAGELPILGINVTIDEILDERARELFTEEPRHNELVRVSFIMAKLNINGYNLANFHEKNFFYDRSIRTNVFWRTNFKPPYSSQSYQISPFNVLWPIPETAITANTLGVINQNLGYSGTERNLPPIEVIDQ